MSYFSGIKVEIPIEVLQCAEKSPHGFIDNWYRLQHKGLTPRDAYDYLEAAREQFGLFRRYSCFDTFERVRIRYQRKMLTP